MSTDFELAASAERMAALANSALKLMSSGIANAQEVAALLAADLLMVAALLPEDVQESHAVAGAVERARRILGPDRNERH